MKPHKSIQPKLEQMVAIATKNTEDYGIPLYEHYNWCLDYLGLDCERVTEDTLTQLRNPEFVQGILVKACTRALKPRIYYNTMLDSWVVKSVDSPYHYFGKTIKDCYEAWEKRSTFNSMVKHTLARMEEDRLASIGTPIVSELSKPRSGWQTFWSWFK